MTAIILILGIVMITGVMYLGYRDSKRESELRNNNHNLKIDRIKKQQ